MATVRRELRMDLPPGAVWSVVSAAGRIHEWFPGIVESNVGTDDDGTYREVRLASGIPLVERIVTNDPVTRRFQYRITGAAFRSHLGTVDVIDLDDGTCLTVYGTDAEPDVMALVIGGATGDALERLAALAADELDRSGWADGAGEQATRDHAAADEHEGAR